jgi:hypothetical protein
MDLRDRYERDGLLPEAYPLADPGVIDALRGELPAHRAEAGRLRAAGVHRVPYLLSDAIARAARDPAVLATVAAVLGTDELVMWGPNLQVGTPNEAGLWHTDIESWLWPTVTVVVGLAGCEPLNATRCIPGSHRLPVQPWGAADNTDAGTVLRAARRLDPRCTEITSFAGFGDGTFYVFDAKCWHAGAAGRSEGRESLFLHYDRAASPRVPYMRDYEDHTWFDSPAAYLPLAPAVRTDLHPVAGKDYEGTRPGWWLTPTAG